MHLPTLRRHFAFLFYAKKLNICNVFKVVGLEDTVSQEEGGLDEGVSDSF
jgi:hypothetical protein